MSTIRADGKNKLRLRHGLIVPAWFSMSLHVNELRKVYKNGRVAVVSRVYFLILGYSSVRGGLKEG